MKMKLIAAAVFLALGIGAGMVWDGELGTKTQQFAAIATAASVIAFLSLCTRDSTAFKAAAVWLGVMGVGTYFAVQPPRVPPPERDSPLPVAAHRTSPA